MSGDLISLEDAIEAIASVDITDGTEPVFSGKQVIGLLKDLDAINPQEPKTGEWQQDLDGTFLCSECGSGFKEQPTLMGKPMFLWCPLCGARMVEPQESEDKE